MHIELLLAGIIERLERVHEGLDFAFHTNAERVDLLKRATREIALLIEILQLTSTVEVVYPSGRRLLHVVSPFGVDETVLSEGD
jgi:hypothetical protein